MNSLRAVMFAMIPVAFFAPTIARAQPAPPASSLALQTRAQELYQQGREHFLAGRYEDARAAFQSSLDTADSPNTRMYAGRALLRLGRLTEAWAMLDRAARDAATRAVSEPRYTPTRDNARAEADQIARQIALLVVDVTPAQADAEVDIHGHTVRRAGFGVEIPMEPGEVTLRVRAPGYLPLERTVGLAVGNRESVSLDLQSVQPVPEATPESTPAASQVTARAPQAPVVAPRVVTGMSAARAAGLTFMVAGGAALLTGAVFGLLSQFQYDQLTEQQRNDAVDVTLRDAGERNRDVCNVLLATGGAAAATGLVLWFAGARRAETTTPRVTVYINPTTGAGLAGRF
jgi:hypothetical protein